VLGLIVLSYVWYWAFDRWVERVPDWELLISLGVMALGLAGLIHFARRRLTQEDMVEMRRTVLWLQWLMSFLPPRVARVMMLALSVGILLLGLVGVIAATAPS
jgi:hypothetical protein